MYTEDIIRYEVQAIEDMCLYNPITFTVIQSSQGDSEEDIPTSVQSDYTLLSVKNLIFGEELNNKTNLTTDATITQPSLGDSEDVEPSLVQPNEINSSTDNAQSASFQNELFRPSSRKVCFLRFLVLY